MNSISEIESLSIRENHAAAAAPIEFNKMDDMGKGTRLDLLLSTTCFYVVEFKGGRSDVFYSNQLPYKRNELVIVEADRGRDLGKIKQENISREQLEIYYVQLKSAASHANGVDQEDLQAEVKTSYAPNEIYIKSIYRTATRDEITLFMAKGQDESKALMVCQSKIKQKKLNMQVVDAEYQW
jgi:cell fate regulator YaaT (PSP1 superfamily)